MNTAPPKRYFAVHRDELERLVADLGFRGTLRTVRRAIRDLKANPPPTRTRGQHGKRRGRYA